VPPSRGNQSSRGFSFVDDEMTFCTQLEYGGLEEYQEQSTHEDKWIPSSMLHTEE
jgi:hypothetical protein